MLLLKGYNDPLPARRLLVLASDGAAPRTESTFVGRAWEMGALRGVLERSVMGAGVVVGLVGPPGIGKTRMVRELTSLARAADVDVFSTACESHTAAVPFHAAAGLLRAAVGANGLEGETARTAVRSRLSGVGDEDLLSVEDLLGIGDPAAALPPGT
jgi:predicted ATPase